MERGACAPREAVPGAWLENWTWIPQDASGDLKLSPIASKVCMHCCWVCLVLAAGVHATQSYSETVPCARHSGDPDIANFFRLTGSLALAGLFFEVVWAICIRFMGLASLYRNEVALRKRLRLNVKMLCVFTGLSIFYHLLAFDVQVVHSGWLARQYGGHQLVYSVRYVEWTTLAPVVLSVSGQLEHSPDGRARNGLIPSSLLTGVYCLISWQALVVTNVACAWALIMFAFLCYFAASAEQLAFAWYIKDKGRSGPVRAGLLIYLVVVMGMYGVWYLMPVAGWMSTTLENKLYCLGDASFKLGTAAMLVVCEDVCATVEMWRQAAQSAEDLATLIDTASVPIFCVDCQGLITRMNKKATNMLQLAEDDIVGTALGELVPESSREKCQKLMRSALVWEPQPETDARSSDSSDSTTLETCILVPGRCTDGESEHLPVLELSASAKRGKSGEATGVTLIGHDITAYKQAEERKARFMATMSHELRSPLHGIIGLSEHLASEEKDDGRAKSLGMITRCSKRLLGLVVDIMDMASLSAKGGSSQAKQMVLNKDPVQLVKIIEEVITLVKSSSDKFGKPLLKRGVQLVSEETASLPVIEADAAKCTQVFFNLVTNACKFTKKGKITISSKVVPGEDRVEVSVSDTGSGISPQNLQRIFKPFEQEDNSMSRGHDGLGLGLAISNEVVRLHGGSITVTSKVGVGTAFTVHLPLVAHDGHKLYSQTTDTLPMVSEDHEDKDEDEDSEELEPERESPKQTRIVEKSLAPAPAKKSGKPVILSVDDDQVNQMIVQKQLRNEYEIVKAMDGEEACRYFKMNVPPDMVLLDYMMPGMDGIEVLQFIRQDLKLDMLDVPVVMVSATDHRTADALEMGCNDFVVKPFEGDMLKARVRAALATKDAASGKDEPAQITLKPEARKPAKKQAPVKLRGRGHWSACFAGIFRLYVC